MYSKEALDLYESMLNKVSTKEAGIKDDALRHISGLFGKMKGFSNPFKTTAEPMETYHNVFKKEFPSIMDEGRRVFQTGKSEDEARKIIADQIAEKLGPHIAKKDPWASVAAMGIPTAALGAGYVGHNIGEAQKEWDQTKAGLTGMAAGLALPTVYSALTGRAGLKGINNPFSGNANQSAISDFTSI